MKFQLLKKELKCSKIKTFLALTLSDHILIMLISAYMHIVIGDEWYGVVNGQNTFIFNRIIALDHIETKRFLSVISLLFILSE